MKMYIVGVKEVHISTRIVEAESPEEARAIAAGEGLEIACEYSYTLDPSEFTVEEDNDDEEYVLPKPYASTVDENGKSFGVFFSNPTEDNDDD